MAQTGLHLNPHLSKDPARLTPQPPPRMSSQPPATAPTGISKSAAKKRAKKLAKALAANNQSAASGEDPAASAAGQIPPGSAAAAAAAAAAGAAAVDSPYSFPPGSYPDAAYDAGAYYDDADLPAAALTKGGAPQDQFSFAASYSFGDRNLVSQPNGSPFGALSSSINITHEDLLETANELWRRMGDAQYGEDDPYWSSLPTHVRQFIREAIPFQPPSSNPNNDPQSTKKDLYAMAQRIVHAASQGMGLQGVGSNLGSNLLSQVNGRAAANQTSIAEDLGFRSHPDAAGRDVVHVVDDYDDDEDFEDEPEPGLVQPNGDAPKKKNKKKKKKNNQSSVVEPPPASLPPPAVKQPPRQPVPPQPPVQPALNPPPPPVTPAPTQPPPSSRAAGKQPMTHAPAPAANPPARSVRAAGKAPVSASPHTHHNHTHPPPPKSTGKGKATASTQPAKIWTTASAEERENITQFWLGLTEAERRDLVQIEKDAVLRRMKEQQRHSCGCAVCGRKKVNIETELEQLYDQYYDELERYTHHQRAAVVNQHCPPPPGAGPFPGSVELDSSGQLLKLDHLAPNPAQHPSLDESDEYEDDEEYDDEEDLEEDDIASDEAEADYPTRKSTSKAGAPKPEGGDDFFGFGSNLATIKGVITVADDMLKNDGAKFLEMMEQLAVKRFAREELNARDLQQEETTDEDDDEDDISETQRMEEGRRMFAIFAARMFEQRVLQAYRERVAKEREEQLLRELEMEEEGKRAKEEKKAKEAQRKKDKKRLQKQRQDEERAAREAALAEEQRLAKLKAEEEKAERQKRQEEERARREAVKRAAQEEAVRKEAERRKRQEEERAREEEAARKKREREEKIRKEREAREREAKEKERREKEERERIAKEKAEKERAAKEARDKAEKERLAKLEEERLEKQRRDEAARREREAAEQKKILAAQQAAREKAAAVAAAKQEKAKAAAAAAAARGKTVPGSAAASGSTSARNGPSGSAPTLVPSPPTPVRPNVRPGAPKTPQPYYSQPVSMASFNARPPFQSGGYRPPFPSQSPVFGSNGMASSSVSPNAQRSFTEPPPPPGFEYDSVRPLGMGFPKSASAAPSRVASTVSSEDLFRAPGAPAAISVPGQRVPSGPSAPLYGGTDDHDFLRPAGLMLGEVDMGPGSSSGPGLIGSRSYESSHVVHPPAPAAAAPGAGAPTPSGTSGSASARTASPSQPERVFGSAALGDDDEIVQPTRRPGVTPAAAPGAPGAGWKLPAAGAGRWSAAPAPIWGMDSPWSARGNFGAPGGPPPGQEFGLPGLGGLGGVPAVGAVGGPGGAPRAPGAPVGSPPSAGGVGSPPGFGLSPHGERRFGAQQGFGYPNNLFGPPGHH